MCGYSLLNLTSRSAKVGYNLTTRDFGTGTLGLLRQKTLDSGLRSCGNGAGVFRCGYSVKPVWSHKCDPPFVFLSRIPHC